MESNTLHFIQYSDYEDLLEIGISFILWIIIIYLIVLLIRQLDVMK